MSDIMEVEEESDSICTEEVIQRTVNDGRESIEEKTKSAKGNKARHTADVYIAEGAYTDCNNLLNKFVSLKTSTFEDFVKVWKETGFSQLFLGRDTYAELFEFSEEVLTIAKSFILPPHGQIKRIGGLYLLYGLYTQQPIRNHVKYRVTPQEWSVILKFVGKLKAHGFIDANYIFHKMCLDGAFLTVAVSREYGLERNYRKYLMPWPARDKELDPCSSFSLETLMGRVYRGSLRAAADQYRNKYHHIKQKLEAMNHAKFQSLPGIEKPLDEVIQENIEDVAGSADNFGDARKFSRKNIGHSRQNLKQRAIQHQAIHRATQSVVMSDPGPSTSQVDPLALSDFDEDSDIDFDSEDSDFEYMMKPPSMRNSRALKIKKQSLKDQRKMSKSQSSPSPKDQRKMSKSQSSPSPKNQRKMSKSQSSRGPKDQKKMSKSKSSRGPIVTGSRQATYEEVIGRKFRAIRPKPDPKGKNECEVLSIGRPVIPEKEDSTASSSCAETDRNIEKSSDKFSRRAPQGRRNRQIISGSIITSQSYSNSVDTPGDKADKKPQRKRRSVCTTNLSPDAGGKITTGSPLKSSKSSETWTSGIGTEEAEQKLSLSEIDLT